MLPIAVKKEQSGYVLDSLLIPLLVAGLKLSANGIADAATIDKTWMIATGEGFYQYPNPAYLAKDFLSLSD